MGLRYVSQGLANTGVATQSISNQYAKSMISCTGFAFALKP